MTPARRKNLERLLAPRHIALIGGRDAETVAGECARIGFAGPVWPVNPKRREIGGHPCFTRIEDLPEPPDAVFIAVPRAAAIESVARLSAIGAGGAVCYTAGFGELGGAGAAAEQALIAAAGDLALVGPNCYGLINYLDRAALWPFAQGGESPGYGAAIVTQSGMLSSDLTMSQRSLPMAYMISAGNQAVLGLEDFVEALAGQPSVRAIGLHIEGLRDVPRFAQAAIKALQAGVPIVALKTGSSSIGAQLTVSHTGTLSGSDALYQALFDRLGIIRVRSPAQLLETLKFLCVAGVPAGDRVAGLTCSGGGATLLADHGGPLGLTFPQPSGAADTRLRQALPEIATVSNPLDYTTPIWGDAHRLPPVLDAMFLDSYDAGVMVQDYPLPELDESKPFYLNDARSFIAATRAAKIPAAICSTLPENIDRETRGFLVGEGVAPMQGINETLDAIAGAVVHGRRRQAVTGRLRDLALSTAAGAGTRLVDEWQGKGWLRAAGLAVPDGRLATAREAPDAAQALGFPVALKMVSARLAHKTEAGAVRLGLADRPAVEAAVARMREEVARHGAGIVSEIFLVERMVGPPVAEMLVSIRNDAQFGLAMTLASGGLLVELIGDAATLLLPATDRELAEALSKLKVNRLLDGHRGGPAADRQVLIDALVRLSAHALANQASLGEVEINPLFVLPDRVCAVDVLLSVSP